MRKVGVLVLLAAVVAMSGCASSEQVKTSGPEQLRRAIDSFLSDPAVSALTEAPPSGADLAAACDSVVPAFKSLQAQLQETSWPADRCASGDPGGYEEVASSAEVLTTAETDAMTALQTGAEVDEAAEPSATEPTSNDVQRSSDGADEDWLEWAAGGVYRLDPTVDGGLTWQFLPASSNPVSGSPYHRVREPVPPGEGTHQALTVARRTAGRTSLY